MLHIPKSLLYVNTWCLLLSSHLFITLLFREGKKVLAAFLRQSFVAGGEGEGALSMMQTIWSALRALPTQAALFKQVRK